MKRIWRIAGWTALVLLLGLGYAGYRIALGHPFTLNQLANRQVLLLLVKNPETFTSVGIADGTVFDRHSGRLTAVGVEKRDQDYAQAAGFLEELHRFDRDSLSRQERITYDILADQYETALAFRRFDWLSSEGLYPISPMFGTQIQLVSFLESQHVVKNEKTARNYVHRLEAMGGKLDALTAEMQRQARLGVVLPLSLLEKSEAVIRDTVAAKPADNALVTSFAERLRKAQGVDAALAEELTRAAAAAVRDGVYPAYARMTAALEALRPLAAQQRDGVDRLPDGAAYYALMLRQMTTTDYSPEQIHALGLAEVERIRGEMDALLRAQGLAEGSVAERVQRLAKDPRFLYPNDDAGRRQALARYQEILDEVAARMPAYFRTLPKTRLTVERVPPAAEKGSAGAYYQPAAMDGSRPGTYFANLRDTAELPTWTMKSVTYHEGIPGHHLQISTAQNLKDVPLIRQQTLYAAYAEGWALYAERLAAEIGMYRDDPYGDLGRLRDEMLRAVRLVADTGLHAKGWTRAQAVEFEMRETGMPEAEVVTEVERYMALPGQACAYKVGQLKILELRDKARAALGPKFSLKDFHAVVLEDGAVPLTLLERFVDEWIARTRAGG
ncbi:MAG: DUF885 domain-containing protein [Proteobacteria bacterium]|nr:DUF885 domain-containing protein [Pseudomonadota bacterium]